MADQFFYDVSVNNSQSENILDQQPATNIPELKTFSQFNHWTLIDGTEVDQFEENADAGIDEGHAVNDECVPIEMKAVHTQVETLLDEEASNYSDQPSSEDYESEELVSRLQRLTDAPRSTSTYIPYLERLHCTFIVYLTANCAWDG